MKMKTLIISIFVLLLSVSGSVAFAAKGGNSAKAKETVAIKHIPPNSKASKDGEDYIIIEVSGAAVAAHLAHGDSLLDEECPDGGNTQ